MIILFDLRLHINYVGIISVHVYAQWLVHAIVRIDPFL